MNSLIIDLKARLLKNSKYQKGLNLLKNGKTVTFDGLVGSSYTLFGAVAAENLNRFLLVVTDKIGGVDQVADDFSLFTEVPIETFPVLPPTLLQEEKEIFNSDEMAFGSRLRVLREIAARSQSPQGRQPFILVSSLSALLQPVPHKTALDSEARLIKIGLEYNRDELIRWLLDGGFLLSSAVTLPGEYAIRGALLDIFPLDRREPIRIEFFGDEVDAIRAFDPATQRSVENMQEIQISRMRFSPDMDGTILEHLPNDTLILFHETDQIVEETRKFIQIDNSERFADVHSTVPVAEMMNKLYQYPAMHAVAISSGNEFTDERIPIFMKSVERFCGQACEILQTPVIEQSNTKEVFLLCCQTEAEEIRLREMLEKSPLLTENRLFFIVGSLSEGFQWNEEETVLLGTAQIFGRLNRRKSVRKRLSKVIDSFLELSPGDLVIHVGHGLARFRGLKTIKKANQEEEHLELEFADNVVLYVPTSKFKLVQRYIGTGKTAPRLAKLNGTAWAKQKQLVQGAVLDLAAEMLELDASRRTLQGTAFPPDSKWQSEFEESFPFVETDDQLDAIAAIKTDMEQVRPMDRLLCGDVGFGKTEVAVRAAFKAVDAGYQAAILVPTTILAEQHFRVFSERMAQFPIKIASLTRFTTKQEKQDILYGLKTGGVDIVIGTHSLTRSHIEFNRLGLVVIDEEQKFGVEDKEQLKKYRNLVDVLTMTATPIPRTLHFSLVGLRDISNLESPPANRLPVETKILHFDKSVIRNAILREIARDGQVYYLHNRVRDIENVAIMLRNIVPEARIRVGHAQMPDSELEEVMRDFILHKFDVLLCTTIIESGLDIPRANTMLVDNPDRFGLAELHQLRGRVGRDKYQAYCYLLVDQLKVLTGDSLKRLKAIEEYAHLGAGFNIAMRDLEIRGAGNILGTEQSGHIAAVGYEMYCDFLDGAVRMLKKQPQRLEIDVEVDLPGGTSIPKSYISDQKMKIDIYRRMQRIADLQQCDDFRAEICDRFGTPPVEVERMLTLARIRVLAFNLRIAAIRLAEENNQKYLHFKFKAPEFLKKLQISLKKRWIDFRDIQADIGCLPLPKKFLNGSDNQHEDELLAFVIDLLLDPTDRARKQFPAQEDSNTSKGGKNAPDLLSEKNGSNQSILNQSALNQSKTEESNASDPSPKKSPLADKLKHRKKST